MSALVAAVMLSAQTTAEATAAASTLAAATLRMFCNEIPPMATTGSGVARLISRSRKSPIGAPEQALAVAAGQ